MSEPSVRVSEPKVSRMVDQTFARSNHVLTWLRQMEGLRLAR